MTLPILLGILMLAVVLVLFIGLFSMIRGGEFNRRYGNKLMVARVGLQGAAVLMLGLLFLIGKH